MTAKEKIIQAAKAKALTNTGDAMAMFERWEVVGGDDPRIHAYPVHAHHKFDRK